MSQQAQAPAPDETRQRAAEHIRRVLAASLRRHIEKQFLQQAERLNYGKR